MGTLGLNLNLGLGSALISAPRPVSPITILDGLAIYGDSFAEGSSGGGSEDSFYSLRPAIERMLAAAALPSTVENNGVSGETSTQALARWRGRETYYAWNLFWAGRNDFASPSAVIANAEAVIADLEPGQILLLLSVHNRNDSADERSGGADYADIAAINVGLAALANGVDVFYFNSRSECVYSAIIDNPDDDAAVGFDQPPPSLTADGLHLDASGTYLVAQHVFWRLYEIWLATHPRSNMIVNGSFDTDVADWTSGDGASLVWDSGALSISGGGAFRSAGQQVGYGYDGRRFLFAWDMLDLTYSAIAAFGRPFLAGGPRFPPVSGFANDFFYGAPPNDEIPASYSAQRRRRRMTTFFDTNDPGLAIMFEAANDSSASWTIDNVVLHEVT